MKVAIVGAACRLPGGVSSLDALWELLAGGIDAVREIPLERFDVEAFVHPERSAPGRSCTFAAGVLDDIENFDFSFFGISKKEAEYMDPQQRLLLELAWEALEDAQIRPSSLAGSDTAVFVGSSSLDASMLRADDPCVIGPYSMIGNTLSLLANRISYLLDIHGPSLTIDTACSSSLVALHQACQVLARGEARMAIAAGVHILCSPLPFVGFSKAHMLSANGRCKVFDASADGYVRAEGGITLLLKPLEDALAQGDRILGVIVKTGVNTDGRTPIGIAYPNQQAQYELMRSLYAAPDLDPRNVCYLETHGTGTTAGDPVEARAIGEVFRELRPQGAPLLVGSVKSNIGHLEPASGLAGLLKTLLVLQKGAVPPNLHLTALNKDIDADTLGLRIPTDGLTPLPATPGPRLAGVSSFGFGGANAHIVLEQAPAVPPDQEIEPEAPADQPLPPLLLSAHSPASLAALASAWAGRLEGIDRASYSRLAGRTALCRDHLSHRLVLSEPDLDHLCRDLRDVAAGRAPEPGQPGRIDGEVLGGRPRLAFVFSGNGGPWPGMGRDVLLGDEAAAAALDRVQDALAPLVGFDVRATLLGDPAAQRLDRIEVVQPLQFALQVCLTEALAARGVVPDMTLGHSIGEVAAAYAAGALGLEDACRVIAVRSVLQAETRGQGGMAVAQLGAEQAAELPQVRSGALCLAAVNSSRYVTLSGPVAALDELAAHMRQHRLVCRRLDLEHPFHSPAMDPLHDRLVARLAGLSPRDGQAQFFSTVTGTVLSGRQLGPDYWWRNIRRPVQFAAAATEALNAGGRILVELGPDSLLSSFIKTARDEHAGSSAYLPSLRRNHQDPGLVDDLWRRIHVLGGAVDLGRFFPRLPRRVALPAYPWDREPCQVEPTSECLGLFRPKTPAHPLLGRRLRPDLSVWENVLDIQRQSFLGDHRLDADVVLPGAAAIEMALAAARELHGPAPVEIENLEFRQPLPLAKPRLVRLTLDPGGDFRLESREHLHAAPLVLHVQGRIVPGAVAASPRTLPEEAGCGEEQDMADLYRRGREAGLAFGPAFRPLTRVCRRGDHALGCLELPPGADSPAMILHPSLIDGGFQMLLALADWDQPCQSPVVYLPLRVGRFRLLAPGRPARATADLTRRGERSLAADFVFFDADGRELARAEHCRFSRYMTRDNAARQQHVHVMAAFPARHPRDDAPAVWPAPAALAARFRPVLARRLAAQGEARRRTESNPFCTAFLIARLHRALSALSLGPAPFSLAQLVAAGRLCDQRLAYLASALPLLADMDLARSEPNGRWRLLPTNLPPDAALWREALRDYPDQAGLLTALADWSQGLDDTLAGRGDLPSFPRFGEDRRQGRDALVAVVAGLVGDLGPGQPVRILEVRAGTGQLARSVLDALPPGRVRYVATDPQETRVEQLAASLAGRPGCAAVRFDPDEPGHGLAEDGFDLVLLAYAGADLDDPARTLERLHDRLRPGGLLLVLDDTPLPLRQLLCGQDPGWWREEEDADRPEPRLPQPTQWAALLDRAGFEHCARLGNDAPDADGCLLAARKSDRHLAAEFVPANRRFVLLADAAPSPAVPGLLDALTTALVQAGNPPVLVSAGPDFDGTDPVRPVLDPQNLDHWTRLWDLLARDAEPDRPVECVHLLGLDSDPEPALEDLEAVLTRRVVSASLLVRAWSEAPQPVAASVCLVTGGGLPLPGQMARLAPSQAGLVGFFRVCCNEAASLTPRLVDVQPDAAGQVPLAAAVREILCPVGQTADAEPEVILTPAGRFVSRLVPLDLLDRADSGSLTGPVALSLDGQGHLDDAVWRRVPDKIPGPGQVRIENAAAGVNYRDVMYALGRIPEEALEGGASGPGLGLECAGVVSAVGEGVTDLHPGDRVCCLAGGCYDSQVLAAAQTVFPLPDSLDFAAAATIPVAHFTAYYALTELARLAEGESILIHGGAGGVGLAAIQLARQLGANVMATAGSPHKRRFLAALGVEHVFDSRSLDFEDQVRAVTDGAGLDVVLNSIAGETLQKSLGLLKPLGRFLELGKVDFYANTPLRMRLLRENISFFGIDLDQVVRERPARCRQLFAAMLECFARRELTPLPFACSARGSVTEAWHAMRRSSHLGKLVVVAEEPTPAVRAPEAGHLPALRPDAAYLVTGGLGGLGLTVAKRLAQAGARHLVLAGRSGAATAIAQATVAELAAGGVRVDVVAVDLADCTRAKAVLAPYLAGGATPLAGLVHCAGILRDATIANLTPADITAVLRAKAVSAYHLHWLTRDLPLDFFVLFSSATTVMGNPGQANYVAANTVLEALAAQRRARGLPGVSLGWGPITDVGMLASRPDVLESLRRVTGAVGLTANGVMDFVERYGQSALPNLHVFRMQWRRLARLPYVASPVHASQARASGDAAPADHDDFRRTLAELPHKEAVTQAVARLSQHIAHILRLPPSRLRQDKPVGELGMDSLMYVELSLAIEETFGVDPASLSLNKEITILTLAGRILGQIRAEDTPSEAQSVAEAIRTQHGLDLSQTQARRLLEAEQPVWPNR